MRNIPSVENKKLVARVDEVSKSHVHSSSRCKQMATTSLELNRKTSHDVPVEVDFCKFVNKLLQLKQFPADQANYIAKNAW